MKGKRYTLEELHALTLPTQVIIGREDRNIFMPTSLEVIDSEMCVFADYRKQPIVLFVVAIRDGKLVDESGYEILVHGLP